MKSSSRLTSGNAQTAQELVSDITQLMAEVEEMLNESTSHHAEETVALFAAPEEPRVSPRLVGKYTAAKDKFATLVRKTDATIRACPYESLAVTLGVGVLVGILLGRRRGDAMSE